MTLMRVRKKNSKIIHFDDVPIKKQRHFLNLLEARTHRIKIMAQYFIYYLPSITF